MVFGTHTQLLSLILFLYIHTGYWNESFPCISNQFQMDYYLNSPSCIKRVKEVSDDDDGLSQPEESRSNSHTSICMHSIKMEHVNMHRQSSDLMTIPSDDITFQKFYFSKHTPKLLSCPVECYWFPQTEWKCKPKTHKKTVQILIFSFLKNK